MYHKHVSGITRFPASSGRSKLWNKAPTSFTVETAGPRNLTNRKMEPAKRTMSLSAIAQEPLMVMSLPVSCSTI